MSDNLPPLKPDLEGHEYELWGQNMRGDFVTVEKAKAYTRAALEASRAAVPAERIEELEVLAARWTQLEYMYGRGIAPDTIAHYIGRPERLDYAAQLHREHCTVAAPPPVAQPLTHEQIEEMAVEEQFLLICDGFESLEQIVRAVEYLHGITASPKPKD